MKKCSSNHELSATKIDDGTLKTMSETIESIIDSSSIEDLKALIKKAEDAINQKKIGEIEAIREKMFRMADIVDMTPEEVLNFSGRRRRSAGVPKYRNPANPEQTWTGRGKKPGWLKQAADPEALRIPE